MSTYYYGICHSCKIYKYIGENLGFFAYEKPPKNEDEMKPVIKQIEKNSTDVCKMIVFLLEHQRHECNIVSEHHSVIDEIHSGKYEDYLSDYSQG